MSHSSVKGLPLPLLLLLPTLLAERVSAAPLAPSPAPASVADRDLEAALRRRLFETRAATPVQALAGADPDSTEWEQARASGQQPPCVEVGPLRYVASRFDLDGDGRPERLALVLGSFACGSRGCSLFIFRQGSSGLEPVAENGLFQTPLRLGAGRSAGWWDLRLSGTDAGVPAGVMDLRFDGLTYRESPGVANPGGALAAGPELLAMPALPFEAIGQPLACEAASP